MFSTGKIIQLDLLLLQELVLGFNQAHTDQTSRKRGSHREIHWRKLAGCDKDLRKLQIHFFCMDRQLWRVHHLLTHRRCERKVSVLSPFPSSPSVPCVQALTCHFLHSFSDTPWQDNSRSPVCFSYIHIPVSSFHLEVLHMAPSLTFKMN